MQRKTKILDISHLKTKVETAVFAGPGPREQNGHVPELKIEISTISN